MTGFPIQWFLAANSPHAELKVEFLRLAAEFGLGPPSDVNLGIWDGIGPTPVEFSGELLRLGVGHLTDPTPQTLYGVVVAVRLGIDLGNSEDISESAVELQLSRREVEVLVHIASGLPNKGIAAELGLSISTVKFHIENILAKLNVQTRTEAVLEGIRRGIIPI